MVTRPEWELHDLNDDNPEHDLYNETVCEFTDISGFPIKYYIKEATENLDTLYGENQTTEYSNVGYETKIRYEPSDESTMIDVFGFSPNDVIEACFIPKSIFNRDVAQSYGNDDLKPVVGDLLITLWNNKRYEVTNVNDTQNIFQEKKFVWELTLTPHKYSEDSDSAENVLNFDPESDFPDINDPGFETQELSGYGENDWIEDESDDIHDNLDSSIYGY